ncbi:hypothetical protein FPV67DRAFT_1358314, partial [Lyophyllum atratum]
SSPLWDLAPSNLKGIVEHGYLHYRRIDATHHVIGIRSEPLVEQWYVLVIEDPRAVVEVFCRRIDGVANITRHLLTHGIRFATGKPVRNPRLATSMPSQHSLGHRNAGYVFTQSDYTNYLDIRRQLLTGPVLRAAMMKGG